MNGKIQTEMSLYDKLSILSDAAKYDVACTSSGVDRKGRRDRDGKLQQIRDMPQLFGGRQMHLPSQDSV